MPDTDIDTLLTEALTAQAAAAGRTGAIDPTDLRLVPVEAARRGRGKALASVGSAVAVAAAIAAVAVASWPHSSDPDTASNEPVAAAPAAARSPYGLAPGQYLKISKVATTDPHPSYVWIPADPHEQWRFLKDDTEHDFGSSDPVHVDSRGECAQFPASQYLAEAEGPYTPACDPDSWTVPTSTLVARNTPAGVDPSLRAAATFDNLIMAIGGGWAPDSVATRVEAAMRTLSCVSVTHGVSAGAGRTGDLIGCTSTRKPGGLVYTDGVVVDPVTGRVLAGYHHEPAHTETVDGRTGLPLDEPKQVPAYTSTETYTYDVVDSITA